ncbi:uncharacterized protein LOC131433937 [Malaya genurostris]|uniref:uncharacterized protein LOC131433937 n=1 Tax=Malaya genurostris TaxID=325434 RepID=UPI0026F3A29F|nr:uncharacterized protein LOC131433937 [Malaya genurostris]
MANATFRQTISSTNNAITVISEEYNKALLELRQEMELNSEKINKILQHIPAAFQKSSREDGTSKNSRKCPRTDDDVDQTTFDVTEGTKDVDANIVIPLATRKSTENMFWLYLSGFNPKATDENIRELVQRNLNTDATVEVHKLVPKETWLNGNILDTELTDQYIVYRCDRNNLTSQYLRGGGVLIGIKKGIESSTVYVHGADRLEQIAVRATCESTGFVICAIYLPPNTDLSLYEQHAFYVNELYNKFGDRDRVVVLGDYNLSLLRWSLDEEVGCLLPNNASSEHEHLLVETMIASGLQQINFLTNLHGKLLDLAFVSCANDCEILAPPSPLMKLDHHNFSFILKIEVPQCVHMIDDAEIFYDFNRCNFRELSAEITRINWVEILAHGTLDETIEKFYYELDTIFRYLVPRRKRRYQSNNKQPWWNGELRNLRNRLRKARKRFFRTKNLDDKLLVRDLEHQFELLNASCFRLYVSRMEINLKAVPKQFWSHLRNKTSSRGIPVSVHYRHQSSSTVSDSANLFSSFFQSVLSNNSPPLSESYLSSLPTYSLSIPAFAFTEREVYNNQRMVLDVLYPSVKHIIFTDQHGQT